MSVLNDFKVVEADKVGNSISELPNKPSDQGYTAAQLKAKFDALSYSVIGLIKLNGLLTYLASSGADDIGFTDTNNKITATKVSGALLELLGKIESNDTDIETINTAITQIKGTDWTSATSIMSLLSTINTIKGTGWSNESLMSLSQLISANTSALATHKTSGDHDSRYILASAKGVSGGVASLDGNGYLSPTQIPPITKITFTTCATHSAMLQLTIADVQNGDVVKVTSEDGQWYMVVNDSLLGTEDAFEAIPKGVIATAIFAQKYDYNYTGEYSIKSALDTLTSGKQAKFTSLTNVAIATSSWAQGGSYTAFPYRALIVDANTTASDYAEVILGPTEATSGDYAPICETTAGGVYVYAASIPSAVVTVPSVVIWRA